MHNKFERFQTACEYRKFLTDRESECLAKLARAIGLTLDELIYSGFLNNPEHLPYDIKEWIDKDHNYRPSKDV